MQTTVVRKLCLVVFGVVASLAYQEALTAAQQHEERQEASPSAQRKEVSKVRAAKVEDDIILARLLLLSEAVQKDLGLTKEQIGKLKDFAKVSEEQSRERQAEMKKKFPQFQSISAEDIETWKRTYQAWEDDWEIKGKKFRAEVLATLTASQNDRLRQIQLQTSISSALARPEMIKALGLTEEQCEKIRTVTDQWMNIAQEELSNLNGLPEKEVRQEIAVVMKKENKIKMEYAKRLQDVLTPDQRAKLEKLQGSKVDVPRILDELIPGNIEI